MIMKTFDNKIKKGIKIPYIVTIDEGSVARYYLYTEITDLMMLTLQG